MGKNKLSRFRELEKLERVLQPPFEEVFNQDYYLKGHWKAQVFKNLYPIVLELGCGKGEYTLGLASMFPQKNYIGIDIKGARLWKGAKIAHQSNLSNVAFLRTRIEFIQSFFGNGEIDEIWITFPDPQIKKRRNKKRLTGSRFLNAYRTMLKDQGMVHLKTDNDVLYEYTLNLLIYNDLEITHKTNDLYNSGPDDPVLSIRTFYESQYLEEGKNINYLSFRLPSGTIIKEPPENG